MQYKLSHPAWYKKSVRSIGLISYLAPGKWLPAYSSDFEPAFSRGLLVEFTTTRPYLQGIGENCSLQIFD